MELKRRYLSRNVLGVALLLCGSLHLAPLCLAAPTIGPVSPAGATRGSEVEVMVSGTNFHEVQEIFFEDGIIQQKKIEAVNDKQLKATLFVPEDAPFGNHRFRVRTKKGLSLLRTFRVGPFPQVAETETNTSNPKVVNNTPDTAQEIQVPETGGLTIAGVVRQEDVDCYRISLEKGQRLSVAVDAVRLNYTPFDPYIDVINEAGFVVSASDDHPLMEQDAILAVNAPESGDYFVRVRESAYGGNAACSYLLHLGRFPTPSVALPPGGNPQSEVLVKWLGDPAGDFESKIKIPKEFPRASSEINKLLAVHPQRDGIISAEAVPFRVTSLPVSKESDANDSPDVQMRVPAPAAIWGLLEKENDTDWIRIEAPKGSKWSVKGYGRRLGSPIDLTLNAYRDNEKHTRITGNDDSGGGPDSLMNVTTPEEGSFLVRVSDHQKRGGDTFVWWIEVEPIVSLVKLSVPPSQTKSQNDLFPQVPRGNRTAVILNAFRNNFSGELKLLSENLPKGVTATCPNFQNGAPGSFVVFEAADDAPLSAAMAGYRAVDAADQTKVLGGLEQGTEMIHGNPNRTPWRYSRSTEMPVAVVEKVPVSLELIQPAVPLVKNGKADLLVRIHKDKGFKGKVRLFFPFKPPGIGAASGVDVPADKTEVVYPINASDKAPLQEWDVVVSAIVTLEGEDAKGRPSIRISSQPVKITVAEPFIQVALDKGMTEQGQNTTFTGTVTVPTAFTGEAKAVLLGLPAKTTAEPLVITSESKEIEFPVTVAADAPAGRHANIVCEVHVPQDGHQIVHRMAATEFRIDKPLPAKVSAAPKPEPPKPEQQKKKISRREQLRIQARSVSQSVPVKESKGVAQ